MVRFGFFAACAALAVALLAPVPTRAQDDAAGVGEIKLTGTVVSVNPAARRLLLSVTAVSQTDGATHALPTHRPKIILLTAHTLFALTDPAHSALADLKEGDSLSVIGRDAGVGKTLTARTVLPSPAEAAAPTEPPAVNMLKPLTDSDGWGLLTTAPALAKTAVEGDTRRVTVTRAGTANWHVQVSQTVAGLEEGRRYVLTGRTRADRPLPLTFYFAPKSATGRNIGLAQSLKATADWKPFRYQFLARGTVGQECVLQLMAGPGEGTVWWSDLTLRPESVDEAAGRETLTETTALKGRWPLDQYRTYAGVPSVRRRYLIAPLRFANTRDKFVEKKEYFDRLFSSEWPGLGHYWRSVSYGKVRVEGKALDWIDLPGNWEDYCETIQGVRVYDRQKLADEVSKRYSMQGFDAIALFPNIRDERPNATSMTVKMQGKVYPGIYCPDYGITVQVCAHEAGHAFGFDHTFVTPGQRDTWDVMGAGGSWGNKHLVFGAIPSDTNAYHKMMAGWITEPQILRLGPGMDKEFHLERLAEPTQDRYLAVVIKPSNSGDSYWTLEARMRAGYDMGAIQREGVVCYNCDPSRRDPTVTIMDLPAVSKVVDTNNIGNPGVAGAAWDVGKTYVNAQYHFSVSVLSRDPTGWTVRVKVDR